MLDLGPLATFDEAKAAYRRLAAIFHPDRFLDARPDVRAEAVKQMGYVNAAWKELEVRLRATDVADREARAAANAPEDLADARREARKWGGDQDFSARARHARTKDRAYRKSSTAGEQRTREAQKAEDASRAEFVRQAQEKLETEQAEQAQRAADAH